MNLIPKLLGILISLGPVVDWRTYFGEVQDSAIHGASIRILQGSTLSCGLSLDSLSIVVMACAICINASLTSPTIKTAWLIGTLTSAAGACRGT